MSGQYPHQQVGGAPVTINNYSGWNQPHSQTQALGASPGNAQSAAHGMSPQHHTQAMGQMSGSSPVPIKFSSTSLNGSGSPQATSIVAHNAQAALSDNLRQNFHIFMNQGPGQSPKGITVSSSTSPPKVPIGSVDLSQSPRMIGRDQSKLVSVLAHQGSKETSIISQNHSVISVVGIPGPYNGDTYPATSASVVTKAPVSPNNRVANTTVPHTTPNNQTGNISIGLAVTEATAIKSESNTEKESINSNVLAEPPSKKIKQESIGNDPCSAVAGVVNSGVPSTASILSVATNQSSTPDASTSGKQDALDVESQLEALFAGIADEDKPPKETNPQSEPCANSQGTPNVVAVLESKGSTNKKGKGKANGVTKTNDVGKLYSTESTPKKKRKKKPVKPWEERDKNRKSKKGSSSKSKYVKEASCDSGSNASSSRIRGPVVHIQGTKEAPTSLFVVNAPLRQDDEDNDSKKRIFSAGRARKIHNAEGKLSSTGLCGNSLVARYESHSSDPRWVCVFCKRGSHVEGLGDLFGPYLVNHDLELENSLDMDADTDRKKDKKNKRSGIGQTGVLGLLAIPPLAGEQPQFMVYLHENCAVWSPSINLIGSRLAGVQEAVWVAVRSKCSRCQSDGANIGCVHHGCSQLVHYPCARTENWSLDVDTFISCCRVHRKPGQTQQLPPAVSIL